MGRKRWAWTIIGVLLVFLVVAYVVKDSSSTGTNRLTYWQEQVVEGSGTSKIVQLVVNGTITQSQDIFSTDSFNAVDFISQLDQAIEDDAVKAVVIMVNSPGGEVVASDEIHRKVLETKQAGKPVVISMGAMAASGGYYISAPANRIFANPSTLTGSLGVIFTIPNYQGTADWLGYKENVIKSGKHKDIGSPLRELTPEEWDIFEKLVDESYQQFVDIIAEGRQIPREEVLAMADGRIYSGRQAKELNLIDEFGSLEDATNYAIQSVGLAEAQIIQYSQPVTFRSLFYGVNQRTDSIKQALQPFQPLLSRFSAEPRLLYLFEI